MSISIVATNAVVRTTDKPDHSSHGLYDALSTPAYNRQQCQSQCTALLSV